MSILIRLIKLRGTHSYFFLFALLLVSVSIKGQESPFPNEGKPAYNFYDHSLLNDFFRLKEAGSNKLAFQELFRLTEGYEHNNPSNIPLATYLQTLNLISDSYLKKQDYENSETYINKAIGLAVDSIPDNNVIIATLLSAKNTILLNISSIEQAAVLIDSTMELYKNGRFQNEKLYVRIAKAKHNTYYNLPNKQDTSLKYLNNIQEIYNTYPERVGVSEKEKLALLIEFGDLYNNLGDFYKAVTYHYAAIKAIEEDGSDNAHNQEYGTVLFSLAIDYFFQGENEKSLFWAHKYAEHMEASLSENHNFLVNPYNAIAVNYSSLGRPEEALPWLKKCLEIARLYDFEHDALSNLTLNLGAAYTLMGNEQESYKNLIEALRLRQNRNGKIDPQNLNFYRYLREHYTTFGQQQKALQYLDSALRCVFPEMKEGALVIPEMTYETITSDALDVIYLFMEQLILAYKEDPAKENYLRLALDYMDFVEEVLNTKWSNFDEYESVLTNFKKFKGAYAASITASSILYKKTGEQKYLDKATHYITASKAIILLAEKGELDLINQESVPKELKRSFLEASKTLDEIDNTLNRLMNKSLEDDSIKLLSVQRMHWANELKKAKDKLRTEHWLKREELSQKFNLKRLEEYHMTDKGNKVVIEYFVGSSEIIILATTGKEALLESFPIEEDFVRNLDLLLKDLSDRPDPDYSPDQYVERASFLYKKLLAPVINQLKMEVEEIVIVADDVLKPLPFELLIVDGSKAKSFGSLDYVINQWKVSYAISSKLKPSKKPVTIKQGILGIAYEGEGISDERAELGGLPGAMAEVDYLEKNYSGEFLRSKSGTAQAFLKKAEDFPIIHLAIHGIADVSNRHNSSLIFNGDKDFKLLASDLYGMELNSKLIVLSACQSGLGKIEIGEGSFSIARSFALAGAPSIVTTLWKVNDMAGAEIVKSFYANLSQGMRKDEALRQAKLTYLKNADNLTSHPYFWGSFVVMGDTSPIDIKKASSFSWYWLLALAVVIFILSRLGRQPMSGKRP